MRAHTCDYRIGCSCGVLATEPDDCCEIHGWDRLPKRCRYCGRFMKAQHENTEVTKSTEFTIQNKEN